MTACLLIDVYKCKRFDLKWDQRRILTELGISNLISIIEMSSLIIFAYCAFIDNEQEFKV